MELQAELMWFQEHKDELLRNYEGKFALVKGQKLIDTFTTAEEAYTRGVALFGTDPFLIKQITREEQVAQIPSLMLGLMNASST